MSDTEKVFEKTFDEEMSLSHVVAMTNIVTTYIEKYPEKNVSVQYRFSDGYLEVYSILLEDRFICLQINGSPRVVLSKTIEEEFFLFGSCLIGDRVDLYYPFLECFDFQDHETTLTLFSILTDAHANLKGMEGEYLDLTKETE